MGIPLEKQKETNLSDGGAEENQPLGVSGDIAQGTVAKVEQGISKNIQILKESDMPNVTNGNLLLAGHNGNSKVSFFT